MSTEVLRMASPGSTRTLEAAIQSSPSLPANCLGPQTPPPQLVTEDEISNSRASTPLSSVMDVDNMSTEPSSPPSATASAAKPDVKSKKPKLTFAEREVLRIEKQFKMQQKAEEKAQKEAEKLEKDKRKRAEAEEKEAKRQEKEADRAQKRKEQEEAKEVKRKVKEEKDAIKQAEIAAKEAEKRSKEEEKAKKERSQMRLNAFFVKRAPSTGSAASSRRNSISSIQGSPLKKEATPSLEELKDEPTEYEKAFHAFFVKDFVTLAPQPHSHYDEEQLSYARERLDAYLGQQLTTMPSLKRTFEDMKPEHPSKRRKLQPPTKTVKQLITEINSEPRMADLTQPNEGIENSFHALQSIPLKYLRYAEDVRPPYIGTYSKKPVRCTSRRLCRKPFMRALPGVNYDYDSEAEWDEPEEGDDCESEEEDSELDDDDEDLAGFLDDEEDAPKRRNVMGDMEPVSTDLFWQQLQHHRGVVEVAYGSSSLDLNPFRIAPLLVEATGPIDPFSTSYWKASEPERPTQSTAMAPPPRVPLNPLLSANTRLSTDPNAGLILQPPPTEANTALPDARRLKTSAKPFPANLLDEFKREIDGSALSKIGLVEVLKKRFPQVTGKTIQETLPLVAKRDGKNQADKKWVLL